MDKPIALLRLDTRSWGPASCEKCEDEDVEEVLLMPNATFVCPECLTPIEGFDELTNMFTSASDLCQKSNLKGSEGSGWERFLRLRGRTWDVIVETGFGDPTKEEERAIIDLQYYGEIISKETVDGLKAGRRFVLKTPYRMRISHPAEPDTSEEYFKTKEELIAAAREMGGGEAHENSRDWINEGGARISIEGAVYGEVFR
jgi:hypothetical protein